MSTAVDVDNFVRAETPTGCSPNVATVNALQDGLGLTAGSAHAFAMPDYDEEIP